MKNETKIKNGRPNVNLDYVPLLDRVAVRVERNGKTIRVFLLQRLRLEKGQFVHHIQYLHYDKS